MANEKDIVFDVRGALARMGFGYSFADPFRSDVARDPKHAYRSTWDCYDKMLSWDGELAAIDGLYRVAVLSHETMVEPGDETPESARAAEFIKAVLSRIDDLIDVLDGFIDCDSKGLSVGLAGAEGYDTEIDGKLSPSTIEILPQSWFSYKLGTNRPKPYYAGVYNKTNKDAVIEPGDGRFIVMRRGATLENPYGVGYLRKCFWQFMIKNILSGYLSELFEYAVEPQLWAKTDEKAWGLKDYIVTEMQAMGRRTATVMPPGGEIVQIPANATAATAELQVIRYYCDLQAKIVLGQTLTSDVGRTGSYELGKIHELQQARFVTTGCRRLERDFNKQFILPLCRLNFGLGWAKWRILTDPERDVAGVVDNVVKLAAKYNLRLGENWLYKLLDIPVPTEEEDEVILEPSTSAPAVPVAAQSDQEPI